MAAANGPKGTSSTRLRGQQDLPKGHRALQPHPYFQAGQNPGLGPRHHTTRCTNAQSQKVFDLPLRDVGIPCQKQATSKEPLKKVRWVIDEGREISARQRRVAQASSIYSAIDPSLIATMALEDFNTQATQPYTDPRRLGLHGSSMSEDDVANVICILHPSAPAAHDAVAATTQHDVNHIIPNNDLMTDDDESLFDPAARRQNHTREIALRISSSVKDQSMGFTFGRNPDRCDVLLTDDRNDITVSNRHFRIYVNPDGVLMLQDTSTNGTLVDDKHLICKKEPRKDDTSRMLQNGTIICVLGGHSTDIKFLVRIPSRGSHQEAYNTNLEKFLVERLGMKSRLMLSVHENNYGMHWNGGSTYNVVGCLGKGAFATVYKLATKQDGLVYAAKELDKRRFMKNNVLDIKFDNEIRIMKDLQHPNIVQYKDYYDFENWVYLIMENVPFGELSVYLHNCGPIAEPTVQTIARQILHALAYLHARGITHRDIKPDNILVSQHDPLQVKLSDFGLSKCITNQETFLKTFCGTLLYCAPEIYPGYLAFEGGRSRKRTRLSDTRATTYSQRVDMWSFGAVLFHVLCNKAPFMVGTDEQNKPQAMLTLIMTEDVDLSPLRALPASEQGIDFISTLLKRNPSLRPTPKACFEHAWISEVADQADYVDLDDEMPAYRGQGLTTVTGPEEGLLNSSEEAAFDQLLGPVEVSFGYLNTAGERLSKRQRVTSKQKNKATHQSPNQVIYPTLPRVVGTLGPSEAGAGGQRLFGEITSSVLKSSGVFAGNMPAAKQSDTQQHGYCSSPSGYGASAPTESSPNTQETFEQSLQCPPTLPLTGIQSGPSPSLLGADVQIGQLNMASPEGPHPEAATTPDTANPVTPVASEDITRTNNLASSGTVKACEDPINYNGLDASSQQPEFDRFIDIRLPASIPQDSSFARGVMARQTEAKERRAQRAKAKTFSVARPGEGEQGGRAKTAEARTSRATQIYDRFAAQDMKISRRIPIPAIESLYPTRMTTADGFTKPFQKFGKLVTVPGSYAEMTIWINSRMTSWGRGPRCNVPYEDKADARVPQYAIQITYYGLGIEKRITEDKLWQTCPGLHTVVSTGASGCIWINGVELRKESSVERCRYYGKIYTGDIITVYQSREPNGPFLKFRVQMHYGDSAKCRPEQEQGFQVLKDTIHYAHELKRIESMKESDSSEATTASGPILEDPEAKTGGKD